MLIAATIGMISDFVSLKNDGRRSLYKTFDAIAKGLLLAS